MWRGAALTLLCLLMFVVGLGRTAIEDSDEAYYAESAREMVASGDWVTPHYNFEPRLQKPILFYWLIAATYTVTGVSETAARIWSALAGAGLAFAACLVAARWIGAGPAFLAGVVVATSFGVVPLARESLPDTPLAFFVTIAIWASIEALGRAPSPAPGAARASRLTPASWLAIAAVAAALGMLTKGPVALALPATVLAPLAWIEWRAGRLKSPWLFDVTLARLALAAGLFVLIAAPWYVAVTRAQGLEYLPQFFVGENIERFATSQYNAWRGYQYVPIIVGGLLPWSAFGLLWLRPAVALMSGRRRLDEVEKRLLAWALGPLAFFVISIGSQPRYILPCLVPMAILLARTIWTRATASSGARDWPFVCAAVVGGLCILTAGLMLIRASAIVAAVTSEWSRTGPSILVAAGALTALLALVVRARRIPAVVACGAAVSLLAFETSVFATGRPEPVEVIAAAARAQGPVDAICACDAFARSLNFYTGVKTIGVGAPPEEIAALLDRPVRVLAAMDSRLLARVEQRLGRTLPRFAEVRYLNAGPSRPGAIFAPNPAEIQTVYLVSNGE